MMRGLLLGLAVVLCLGAAAKAQDDAREPLSIIVSNGDSHAFTVEVARSSREKARGLMHRQSLAPDAGMLFVYKKELRQSMWMKNTLIPLDMLFIRQDGRISHIHQRAVPRSLKTISSRGRVLAVLELRGGTVARLGIRKGDRVEHPAFGG
jgi:uncharacterized membrane protein (UPF0127 family)